MTTDVATVGKAAAGADACQTADRGGGGGREADREEDVAYDLDLDPGLLLPTLHPLTPPLHTPVGSQAVVAVLC